MDTGALYALPAVLLCYIVVHLDSTLVHVQQLALVLEFCKEGTTMNTMIPRFQTPTDVKTAPELSVQDEQNTEITSCGQGEYKVVTGLD